MKRPAPVFNLISSCSQILFQIPLIILFAFLAIPSIQSQDCDNDTDPPSIICPDDVICFFDLCSLADPGQTGSPNVTDLCDPNPIVSFTDEAINDTPECNSLVERTWTATDAAGNSTSCIQIIDCIADDNSCDNDIEAPGIICPDDVICFFGPCSQADPVETGFPDISDLCDPDPDVTFSDEATDLGPECNSIMARTWTATDAAGNSTSCTQLIDCVADNEDELTIECPADLTIECGDDTNPDETGFPATSGGCPGDLALLDVSGVSFNDDLFNDDGCLSPSKILRTWTAVDFCDVTVSCIQVLKYEDNNAPEILDCPNDVTIDCGDDTDPSVLGVPNAFDDCTGEPFIDFNDGSEDFGCCDGQFIQRIWIVIDDCNNQMTCLQTITILPLDCDDGDPCTEDFCQVDDGGNAFCVNIPVDCNDGNPCTDDFCDPETGQCINVPVDCDDGNPCTEDFCDPETGQCINVPVDCDDGNPCTVDFCDPLTGECINTPVDCDDGNPCTVDSCDPLTGECINTPVDCDDGNPCTDDFCDPETGQCINVPIDCDDGNPCTVDSCDPLTGECINTPVDCDDNDPCTEDFCQVDDAGNVICVNIPINCDDNDPCTEDFCDPETGQCMNIPIDCDDGNPCTLDFCDAETGQCINVPVDCDDNDPCTIDSCDPDTGECIHTPVDCDDNNPCTEDFCEVDENGNIVCLNIPVNCDDGDPCTDDFCDPETGQCFNVPIDCDDGNPCTLDFCDAETGQCINVPVDCDDSDPCTIDSCDPDTGECIHIPVDCDDGNPCTEDFCEVDDNGNIVCLNIPINCDDGDPCTEDFCDSATGECFNIPIDCDDGNPCTEDFCEVDENGNIVCVNIPVDCDDNNPCTIDSCDPDTGECINTPIDCDDNNPCTVDICEVDDAGNIICVNIPVDCDDNDPCTEDFCDPETGECIYVVIDDCGGEPPLAACKVVNLFVDPSNPDFNGPGSKDIWLIPAALLDGGSSSSGSPTITVRRTSAYINFDWTTGGACVDLTPNGSVNNNDRGKVYRSCLPVRPKDFNRNRRYLLKISDEYGTSTCKGRYRVIPQIPSMVTPLIHINDLDESILNHEIESRSEGEIQNISDVQLIPNPGSDRVQVRWTSYQSDAVHIFLKDLSGKTMLNQELLVEPGQNRLHLDVDRLPTGVYLVQVVSKDGFKTVKWVKAK